MAKRVEGASEPAFGDRPMDAADQRPELGHRGVGSGSRFEQQPARAFDVTVEQILGHPELQRQRDELGLCTVMQVALMAAPSSASRRPRVAPLDDDRPAPG